MTEQIKLFMGPQHPSMHGLWALELTMDGERVVDAKGLIGYLHRGFEYLATKRTYHGYSVLTDRLCYVSSMSQTAGYVMAAERLMGVEAPPRAQVLRVLMLELQRIASHCLWLAAASADMGSLTMLIYPMNARELFVDLFEMATGQRLTYAYPRIGGVAKDIPKNFKEKTLAVLKEFEWRKKEFEDMILESSVARMRMDGVGYLSRSKAIGLGVAGPNLRASGIKMDLRKLQPYWGYDEYDFEIPVRSEGDCLARYEVRYDEMDQSVELVKQALDKLDDRSLPPEIMVEKAPRTAPEGSVFTRIEDSRGEMSWYLVGNGSDKAERLKIRAPSFSNIQALEYLAKGQKLADVPVIVGSMDLCVGDLDR